jgi:protein-tyrosine phosphatase
MKQIPPYPLWLGHAGDGRDFKRVFDAGIKALVELAAEEPPSTAPRDLVYCRFPLLDGSGNDQTLLALAINTLASLLERQVPTLVGCGAGMSRSPAVAAAALALVYQEPPEDCLRQIVAQHPCDISPALWEEVTGFLDSVRF